MRIGASAVPPQFESAPAEAARERGPQTSAADGAAPTAAFSALLAQRLREPRDRIELTRDALHSAIDGVRPGASFELPAASSAVAIAPGIERSYGSWHAGGADPFGWRDLTRTLGDQVVAPGFGQVFEAQIQQESGFDPEVAFGYRRSSAGAEGIAQLMPQYYAGVDRRDPEASLKAAAQSMRHYLAANGGDVRKALASYNAGLGTVQSLVAAHGVQWERGLPAETKQYLAGIVGSAAPSVDARGGAARAFGGRGPHGVLSSPLDGVLGRTGIEGALELLGAAGATVRAPADGSVAAIEDGPGGLALRLEHGNGWGTLLGGLGTSSARVGDLVRRGQAVGVLPNGPAEAAALRLGLLRGAQAVDPRPYLLTLGS